MYCSKCGLQLPDGSSFCPRCGASFRNPDPVRTIQVKCKTCGSVMSTNPDNRTLTCPYCGSKQMIVENDNVTMERLRNQTELERQQAWKDVELKKLQHEKEKVQTQQEQDKVQQFQKSKFRVFILIFLVICAILCIYSFSSGDLAHGFIALSQSILLMFSWLLGMQIIKGKKPLIHILLFAAALLLIIPYNKVDDYIRNVNRYFEEKEVYVWPSDGLSTMLPQPESVRGKIYSDSEDRFSLNLYGVTSEQYQSYLSACKEQGFTLDSETDSNFYDANNEEGYQLSLFYYEHDKEIDINLEMPSQEEPVNPDEMDTTATAPAVVSQPVTALMEPTAEVPTTSPAEPTVLPTATELSAVVPTESSEMIDGMRKEFKEAMDSYETFFDQYVAFMQKYQAAPGDLSLLGDYAKFLAQYSDMMSKMDEWDDGTLSNTELSYYIEVTSRISQKLLTVAQ